MVGWRLLNDALKLAWIIQSLFRSKILFPGLFPGFVFRTRLLDSKFSINDGPSLTFTNMSSYYPSFRGQRVCDAQSDF